MKEIAWLVNRLRAMRTQEIAWRVLEKIRYRKEYDKYYSSSLPITDIPINSCLQSLHIDIERLSINWDNNNWNPFIDLDLFGVFDYKEYKKQWNGGFQTEQKWPERNYSPTIEVSQLIGN